MCSHCIDAQSKLASDVSTQVDLTADGEYLYTAAIAHCLWFCLCDNHILLNL